MEKSKSVTSVTDFVSFCSTFPKQINGQQTSVPRKIKVCGFCD